MSDPKPIAEDAAAAADSRRDRVVRRALTGLGLLVGLWMIALVSGVLGFRPFPDIPFVSDDGPPGSIWLQARDGADSEPAPPAAPAESGSGSPGLAASIQPLGLAPPALTLAAAIPPAPAAPRPGARDGRRQRAPGGRGRGRDPGPAPDARKPGPSKPPGNSGGNGHGNAFGHSTGTGSNGNGNAFGHSQGAGPSGNGNAFGHSKGNGPSGNGNAFGHSKGKGHKR